MIFSLDIARSFFSHRPILTSFIAGLLAGMIQPPLFYLWFILGFTVFAYQINSSKNFYEVSKRHFAFAMGFFGYGFYWTIIAISIRLSEFWWSIPIALFGMPLIFVLHTLPASIIAWRFRKSVYFALIFASSWTIVEWVTSFSFTGLPWMLVGYGMAFSDIFSQSVNLIGIYGISFVMLYVSFSFHYILYPRKKVKKLHIYLSIFLLSISGIYGYMRLAKFPLEFTKVRARILQPTSEVSEWNFDKFWKSMDKQINMSKLNARIKPDIIVWPESSIAANYNNAMLMDPLSDLAQSMDAILAFGTISLEDKKHYNSFVGISPEGDVLFDYRKKHLVPFGEYMPMKKYLPINKLTFGIANYSSGDSKNVFYIDKIKMNIRPLICYESLFPSELKNEEADIFINATNTAWYGRSTAPYHLFYVNKFRAIENSTPFIVSSTNGISGMFDSLGRVVSKTNLNDITALDLYIPRKTGKSFENRLYGLLFLIMILFCIEYLGYRYDRAKY